MESNLLWIVKDRKTGMFEGQYRFPDGDVYVEKVDCDPEKIYTWALNHGYEPIITLQPFL